MWYFPTGRPSLISTIDTAKTNDSAAWRRRGSASHSSMNSSSRSGAKRKTNGTLNVKRYIFILFHFNGYLSN